MQRPGRDEGSSVFEEQTVWLECRELKQIPEGRGQGNGRWTGDMSLLEGAWAGKQGRGVGTKETEIGMGRGI